MIGPMITGVQDSQLRCSFCSNGINGSLVIFQDEVRIHIVGLIHQSKDDLFIVHESPSELAPEGTKLSSGGGLDICGIANDASCCRLLGGIVVTHVVVWIKDAVCSFGHSDVVDCICELGEMLLYISIKQVLFTG